MYITHYLISALFAILFLAACSSDPATATLDRAETLMEQYPDSALAMLDTLSPPTSAGENARYALLYSQALDKNHIDVADDSLISIAVNYYENSNDLQRHMLSQYYHARILYNKKSYPRSLLAHHKSLKCAEELGDDFWCGRNAGQISTIYYDFYHSSDAFNYAQLSYEYLKKSGRQPFLNYAILELSHAYYEQESYDNALRFAKNALDSALKYNDKELYICARGIGADCHYYLGQYDNAINDYLDLLDIEYRADIIGLLGLSYLNSNQLEKAAKLRTDTIESDAIRFLLLKSEINKRKGDYKSALSLVENVMFRNDSVLEMSLNQGLSSELSNYYLFDNKIKDLELANLKMTYFITISVIIIYHTILGNKPFL